MSGLSQTHRRHRSRREVGDDDLTGGGGGDEQGEGVGGGGGEAVQGEGFVRMEGRFGGRRSNREEVLAVDATT